MVTTLNFTLDTINTYWGQLVNSFNPKTTIIREHRDRWTKVNNTVKRVIDRFNEGFNPALNDVTAPIELTNSVGFSPCYLVWLSNSEITPEKQSATPIIPCMCTDQEYTYYDYYKTDKTSTTLLYDFDAGNQVIYITNSLNPTATFTISTSSNNVTYTLNSFDSSDNSRLKAVRVYNKDES